MKKVAVVGCLGIGKEKFAKELSKKTRIPYYDTKEAYFVDESDSMKSVRFVDRLREITERQTWVMTGGDEEILIEECDTVFFLNYPRSLCTSIMRANKTLMKYAGSMARFFIYKKGEELAKVIETHSEKNVWIFKTEEEKNDFLNNLLP